MNSTNYDSSIVLLAVFTAISMSLFSCEKELEKPFGDIPTVELLSVSDTDIKEFKDQLIVRLKYQDGNGDLGSYDPDVKSVWVKDDRLVEPDWYFLSPLSPPETNIAIQGEIDIVLNGTFLLGTSDEETTIFNIKIRDRAGNWSNSILTPLITISK